MKALILAIVLIASTSFAAGDVAILSNRAGTGIRFTDIPCKGETNQFVCHSSTDTGEMLTGCYFIYDDLLITKWDNGATYSYNASGLVATDYGKKTYLKK